MSPKTKSQKEREGDLEIEARYEAGVAVYYCHEPGCGGTRRGDIVGMAAHLIDVHQVPIKNVKDVLVAHTPARNTEEEKEGQEKGDIIT